MNLHDSFDDTRHFKEVERKAKEVRSAFEKMITKISSAFVGVSLTEGTIFSIDDYPRISILVDSLLKSLTNELVTIINRQTKDSWSRGTGKFMAEIKKATVGTNIPDELLKKAKVVNLEALSSFQKRKANGINLSDRVWKITTGFKKEMEFALDVSLTKGDSAQDIARKIKHLLNNPDKLYRRVRDKHGNLVLSQNAKLFKPGNGVYRNSFKNAMRLSRTENNIAYHSANYEKYNEFDFVVGIEVKLSNNPLHCPMCESLAGKYPKDFKFTGWHPQCRCTSIPILKTIEEMDRDNKLIASGKEPYLRSSNKVFNPPKGFVVYVTNNYENLLNAPNLPYFAADNTKYIFKK
ncbi:hypothetical protein CMU19_04480 [Elizabethkingia anophelis]|nr:hypothetical protein [Elizabethkingia anophelis]